LRWLEHEGYLIKDATSGRYKIGLAVVALARRPGVGIRTVAEPALFKLTARTGLSGGIGVLERGHVLLVDRVESPRFVDKRLRAQRDIGRKLPVHSTGLGKVLLAYLPRPQVLDLIAGKELTRSTAKTVTSKTRLLAELDQVRNRDTRSRTAKHSDLRSLSVPIIVGDGSDGSVQAALSVNGSPKDRVWLDLPELVKIVQEAARDISRRAGSSDQPELKTNASRQLHGARRAG
jgi:IclR family acetate operon transcriptional repressor